MSHIHLSTDLALPIDIVTQTTAIIAKRRVGKSFTARKLAEQLHACGQQIVIVDPKGDWWGIKSSRDGKRPGVPVVIFGGERGDVPLEPGSGELVARLVVEEQVSALLDLSLLRKHEIATFMAPFLETLYRLKAREQYRTPLALILEEADAIAPQTPQPNEARMLGAAEDIVRRGGQRGLGCIMVTQRTAVLNKNVLTQAQVLIALRTVAPQDLKAMSAWIDVHGEREQRDTLMASLPSLPVGDAWVWSPGWPTDRGIFQRVHVAPIATFDSGATPKPGEKRAEPKTVADVDLEAIKAQMAETIERRKAEDPKELQKALAAERAITADLREKLSKAHAKTEVKRVEVPVLAGKERQAVERLAGKVDEAIERVTGAIDTARQLHAELGVMASKLHLALAAKPASVAPLTEYAGPSALTPKVLANARANAIRVEAGPGDAELGKGGLRRILIALAQRPQGLTNRQIGLRAGLSSQSGTFSNYISRARQAGWIRDDGDRRFITDAGLAALGSYDTLPTGPALVAHWVQELGSGSGAARMLRALETAFPRELTNEELGERAGISAASGTFSNYVSRLRGLELITGGRGKLRASEELFS